MVRNMKLKSLLYLFVVPLGVQERAMDAEDSAPCMDPRNEVLWCVDELGMACKCVRQLFLGQLQLRHREGNHRLDETLLLEVCQDVKRRSCSGDNWVVSRLGSLKWILNGVEKFRVW